MAFKYLGFLLFPMLIGYGVYSMLYNEHKGWYSFILNMIYGFLLMFGEHTIALIRCTLACILLKLGHIDLLMDDKH